MAEIRRYSLTAIVLLVVLRLALGWQLLYEGLWKIDTLGSSTPWSSDGYLKSAQGPMRNLFRSMTGDPDDKSWLDEKLVSARWDLWRNRFASHYHLDEKQAARLKQLTDGPDAFAATLETLPPEVDFKSLKLDGIISYDPTAKQLRIDGRKHMLPSEKQTLIDQVADKESPLIETYRAALDAAYSRASRLSYKERMRAHLKGNPDNVGLIDGRIGDKVLYGRIGQIALYDEMLQRYEQKLPAVTVEFERNHLDRLWSDTRARGRELAGPVMAMDAELREEAVKLLTLDQLRNGALSEPWSRLKVVDTLTIAGLAGLGFLLILGLFTRFAAFSAAFMVFGFYMAMPPLPGVPDAPGPEHSFIVNKNLIEVLALLALASVPTGYWFGLDNLICRLMGRRRRTVAVRTGNS